MDPEKITKELFALLESLSDSEWKIKVNEKWTVKDVIAHLVGWEKESVKCLREEWKTKKKPWFFETDNYDEFNNGLVREYKKFSPKELINEWKKQINRLEEETQSIGEEKLRENMDLFGWVFGEGEDNHYLIHLNQIKRVLKKPSVFTFLS
ncbi:MAG: ClbS/DfsB family four-helix bundle protein [Nanoarchaeota archaeon]|nr:ClbS/DfsB family four-helix bundle protein [Nanoarchaeota archaeon]MBU0976948.1 ClbS/DfsB family four-helix bundle protein [Nanoarchaeota archaeon]